MVDWGVNSRMPASQVSGFLVAVMLVSSVSVAAPPAIASCSRPGPPIAHAAKVTSISDTVRMRLISKHGETLNERGAATGSVGLSPIVITFYGVNAERGTATMTGYSNGSSMSGRATLRAYTAGYIGHFEGYMTITKGTGKYARVHGHELRLKGTINRHDFNVYAELVGKIEES